MTFLDPDLPSPHLLTPSSAQRLKQVRRVESAHLPSGSGAKTSKNLSFVSIFSTDIFRFNYSGFLAYGGDAEQKAHVDRSTRKIIEEN